MTERRNNEQKTERTKERNNDRKTDKTEPKKKKKKKLAIITLKGKTHVWALGHCRPHV